MAPLGKRLRRWLYLGHRWLGILTCLLFAVWFVSGVVMMYVGFPRLTDAERRAALPPITWDRVAVEPEDAVGRTGLERGTVRRLDLAMLDAEPVYRVTPWKGPHLTISATDGRVVAATSVEQALATARHHPAAGPVTNLGLVERDQWTVPQRFNPLRPFHLIALGDAADTHLYISAVTGEIALDTNWHERFWNWFGAVPHWIYFTPLRSQLDLWRDVVLWLSGLGIVGAVTGMTVGVIRVRLRRRYARGAVTPYRGWMAWHHLGGLVAGTALVTFIASGWISMNPNRWFSSREPDQAALSRYEGGYDTRPPLDRAVLTASCPQATEARFTRFDGQAQTLLSCADNRVTTCCGASATLSLERIVIAAGRLLPDHPRPEIDLLTAEDLYWYSHHRERQLPVLRVRFTDAAETWFHIDPKTGEILSRIDRSNRVYRWLFNALHSFDFMFLTQHRPIWDILVLILSIGGLLISISGAVIAWRRLKMMMR
ncbi:PepSY domain-containing protein [Methylorubrum extorquens]|jgi:hypothetical protein|uniref:PepSY domain-containing protein n=1 Tax=Methylorubrum extorquens TaxID=408 RepID=UPI001EE5665D|nr:PepSY domain-containing protein [Methylorubrum extorquens]MCG5248402.1 PepSY domain-containing protein [Methylorubrum extorquens]